jgi:LCP family protein required for cell wall assembly
VPASAFDLPRSFAALLSSLLPGLGQGFNRRPRAMAVFLVPTLVVLAVAWVAIQGQAPTMLIARMIAPPVIGLLLALNLVVLLWRLVAAGHAFWDRRYPRRAGPLGTVSLAAIVAITVLPHAVAWSLGTTAQATFDEIFSGATGRPTPSGPVALERERLNVLLMGIDSGPGRTEALTDTMIVVSLDPVGKTVSMLSIPRDLASVPLANGDVFGPKINSLMSYADRHPDQFPDGGVAALEGAIGRLLGIPIHAYATVDLGGFVSMVDAVGGVDIRVRKALSDPNYGGFGVGPGWSIEPGLHHLDGANALAYSRIRKSAGESDFTRAARQQEVLIALRDRVAGPDLLFRLPGLLRAVGSTIRTDLPRDRLPQLAALAEEIDSSSTVRVVLTSPQIKSGGASKYGSTFLPVPSRIAQLTKVIFGPPGADPRWPPVASGQGLGASASAVP